MNLGYYLCLLPKIMAGDAPCMISGPGWSLFLQESMLEQVASIEKVREAD